MFGFRNKKQNASELSEGDGVVRIMFPDAPKFGSAIEVADGVWWSRLPLPGHSNHVNIYLLRDGDSWTLVDTGMNNDACRQSLDSLLDSEPFRHLPLKKLIVTHYHPDHIGLAGEIYSRGVPLWTSRLGWLYARMMQMDKRDLPAPENLRFAQRAGLKGQYMAAYSRRPPSDYPNNVLPIPLQYNRIAEGDILTIGNRQWTAKMGNGHATEHLTLWSNDGLAITGDQIIPAISASLTVRVFEPDADPVKEWIASCQRFIAEANDQTLCLPGHNQPFCGAVVRCKQLVATQEAALIRLLEHVTRPRTAVDCIGAIYRRSVHVQEASTMLLETIGFLNHLMHRELVRRITAADGSYLWQIAKPIPPGGLRLFESED